MNTPLALGVVAAWTFGPGLIWVALTERRHAAEANARRRAELTAAETRTYANEIRASKWRRVEHAATVQLVCYETEHFEDWENDLFDWQIADRPMQDADGAAS